MTFQLLVDGPEFRDRLLADLAGADRRAWIATLSFEADRAGLSIAEPLADRGDLDRRVLVDALFTSAMINDRFVYRPDNLLDEDLQDERRATGSMLESLVREGLQVRRAHPPGPLLVRFLQRGHKKLIVVDDVAYVGGINLSDHNFAWHDLMVRIEQPALVEALAEDFRASWQGRPRAGRLEVAGHRLTSLDGSTNPQVLQGLLDRVGAARDSLRLVSPYLSPPFLEPLRTARRHGASVEIVTPDANNWPLFRAVTLDEARRHDYEVHLYPDRMNHTKALLVDDETLVVGSTNFDLFSYWLHEEIVLEIEDPELVEAFRRRVLDPDRKASHAPTAWPNRALGAAARAGLHAVSQTVRATGPVSRSGPRVQPLRV